MHILTMDFKSKSRLWVGNMYQRFETMCQEVDNVVNLDAVKYVENHVETVKKICSDAVEIKKVIDLVKQTTIPTPWEYHQGSEVNLARNTDVVSTIEKYSPRVEENELENSSVSDDFDSTASPENDSTGDLLSYDLIDNENSCVSLNEDASSTAVNGQDSQPSHEVEIVHCNTDTETAVGLSEISFSVGSSRDAHTLPGHSLNDIPGNIESCADSISIAAHVSENSTLLSSTSAPIVSSNQEETNSVPSMELTDKSVSPLNPRIDYCNMEEAETGLRFSNVDMPLESIGSSSSAYVVDGLEDSGMETIDLFDELKPEESCIVVDNSMLYEVVRRIHRQRSYKKKIQDLFNTRKRLNKEYEQLAIWCGDLDIGPSRKAVTSEPAQVQLSQDSEWELL